jgi:hypothetical protein
VVAIQPFSCGLFAVRGDAAGRCGRPPAEICRHEYVVREYALSECVVATQAHRAQNSRFSGSADSEASACHADFFPFRVLVGNEGPGP